MALQDLLNVTTQKQAETSALTEERIRAIIPVAREYIAFWREYPDIFVDMIKPKGGAKEFKFFFYQRVFLRVVLRHKYVYCVFPRA